ncbi:ABC transporter permease subunit [Paenibacillus sp. GSMTC-2017]|uniref:ABC transporter permease subunit n=1 Tax=Paenibacillus sp. GSMTC-2017 TaxID=2794350 RepID=UPI0018D729C5|nr:ABC transporter permease subunit [Paenibacillus sp. GSMTC-2017]MBH5319730.1 ABC transporter permease subunit [Paenibacillus sp. GSMTC-2017]
MNLFWREMKASRKSLILWIIGIVVMVGGGMSKFAGLSESGDAMNDLMADMPKALQAIFGINGLNISSPTGYFGILFLYLIMMAAVHASMLGANIIAKEERDKTSEFLLVKPISRSRMLAFKLLATVVNVILFNLTMLVSAIAVVGSFAEGGAGSVVADIVPLILGMLLVQLMFVSIGVALASSSRKPKRAVALSAGIMMLTFLLSIIIETSGGLVYLRYLTPFQYFEASNIINDGIDPVFVALSILIVVLALIFGWKSYNRRDLLV